MTHYLPNVTLEYRVTGLTALTTYTIEVAAMTAKGQGQVSASTISSGVPPGGCPPPALGFCLLSSLWRPLPSHTASPSLGSVVPGSPQGWPHPRDGKAGWTLLLPRLALRGAQTPQAPTLLSFAPGRLPPPTAHTRLCVTHWGL